MFEFGSGTLWGVPIGGNFAVNPTPKKFGTLQDVSLDISGDVKQLYGQKQFPEAVARGKCKITGKAKYASINGKQMNDLFFGQQLGVGTVHVSLDEPHTVATGTATATNTPITDLGVVYQATGLPLVKVPSTPAQGQYSQSGATYTFNSSDNNVAVLISYSYASAGSGTQANIKNQLMGFAPTIQIMLETVYNSNQCNVMLYSAIASKLTIATKQEDFIIPEFDFECFANAAGNVIDIYFDE